MRMLLGILAASLLGLATPASAATVLLNISGTVYGTQSTIVCPRTPSTCNQQYPSGNSSQTYANSFMQTLLPLDLQEGDNNFSYGDLSRGGLFTGIITNTNGTLVGRDLYYSFESPGVRSGVVGSTFINASAKTFSVSTVTAVPEPATWAMMLLGFLAVGTALRQAPRRALLPA